MFSPDGALLITAWGDGTLRVWDAMPLAAAQVPGGGRRPDRPPGEK